MSNYSVLKQDINNNIYENQTQQITGTVLNAILNEMTASLGAGYQFAGVATVGMNPGDPDQRVFYLAGEGIYTSFGGIQVPAGKLGVLKWDNRWTLQTIDGLGGGGANLTGYVSVASTDDLPDEGQPTLGYLCGTNLYLYVGEGGDTKGGKYQDCGAFRGPEGVGITEIEQVEQSTANGGRNTIRIHLSNGNSYDVYTRNGTTSTGLFPTLEALQAAYPSPVVGQYAFVGAGFPADIYVCNTAGTWTDSGADYDGDNVDLTNYATKAELNQLEAKMSEQADSVEDADYAIRAATSSSSLVDNPAGTMVRIVFKVNAGDIIRLSTTYLSGYSVGIWDTPANCVYAGTGGLLQPFISGYETTPIVGVANFTGYLGVSFSNGNTAISNDLFAQILASLSVYIGGSVADRIHNVEIVNTEQGAEVDAVKEDVYAEPLVSSTSTNALTPSSYVNKSGGPIEDTTQVMPSGAKLTKVKLFSTGSVNSIGDTFLYIYDNNRTLVDTIDLGQIQATDTTFDISSKNIIVQEGYHYAFDRVGYKYDTSIPNGRFLVAATGNQTDTKSWFGWTFTYETPQTKLDEFIADNSDLFDKSLRVVNPLMPFNYSSYANGNPVEDLWQNLPVGAKLTKIHCSTRGAAGGNYTFLHIYDETRTQVGERIQLGQIQATDTIFDISAKNIIVQEGYHYCIQYAAAAYVGTNVNHYRYYTPSNDSYPYSGYQFGFSFEFETTKDQRPETDLSGKYASFIGDSICEGAGFPGGYSLLIARKYGMLPPQNNGSSGAIVTSIASESGRVYINTMVDKMDGNADFYIAEGGVNDADLSAPLGALSSGFTAELDTATFYGAMETLCKNLATLHNGKKVGYIFAHRVSLTTKYAYDYTGENNYYKAAKECCEKWGIPFLDLNKHCPPLGCVASLKSSYTKDGDGYHPNEAGYSKYYVDMIAAWMQTL